MAEREATVLEGKWEDVAVDRERRILKITSTPT
jgi:hypothetical protein